MGGTSSRTSAAWWNRRTLGLVVLVGLLVCLVPALAAWAGPAQAAGDGTTRTVVADTKTKIDDSEEFLTNSESSKVGDVDDVSSDLELCKEKPGSAVENDQIVAVRFADLAIPQGATITGAFIQFTADQDNDAVTKSINPFSVNIYAEDAANSAPIQDVNYNISSRTKTADHVTWSLDGDDSVWAVLESGPKEQTPDLTALVQAVVNKNGWTIGNALTFLLTGNSGCRSAADTENGHGPVLHVTYTLAPSPDPSSPVSLIAKNSVWKYNDTNTDLGTAWRNESYDDSAWLSGKGPLGYPSSDTDGGLFGPLSAGTALTRNSPGSTSAFVTYYFRKTFDLSAQDLARVAKLDLTVGIDDGYVLYVNGAEVKRYNMPTGSIDWQTWAPDVIEPTDDAADITAAALSLLHAGTNTIAVEVHNRGTDSSDIYFDAQLVASGETTEPTPTATVSNVVVNVGANESQRLITWYSTSANSGALQASYPAYMTGSAFPSQPGAYVEYPAVRSETAVAGVYSYKVTVTGLSSNTDYIYRVGNADGWSGVYHLTTQKLGDGSFSFLFAGDPQIGSSGNVTNDTTGWSTTLDKATSWFPKTDFLLSVGDQVEHATNETEYAGFLAPAQLRSLTMADVIGNHDSGGVNFKQHFSVPNAAALSGDTAAGGDYWWSYEGALFMAINSNNLSTAQHQAFLEAAIAAYKAQNGGKDPLWKIVSFHHAPYSVASHTTDGDILQRRTELPVVFKELGIDVVLGGHDHSYARTLMMDGTTPITTGYTAEGADQYASYTDAPGQHATVYIAANSASGSKYYAIQNLSFPFLAKDNQENTPNIGKVDVSADKLVFTVYRTGAANTVGDVVDTFTLNAAPAPKEIRGVTIGVGADETQRLVTWYGNSNGAGELQVAPASAMTGDAFPAAHQTFSAVKASSSVAGFNTFKAAVTGLASDTRYVYRVGNSDAWSAVYHLTTQKLGDGGFSFLFAGDPQIGSSGNVTSDTNGWTTTLNHVTDWFPNSDFLLSLGDQVEHATNETEYAGFLAPDALRSLTLAADIGNHDSSGVNFKEHFSVPNAAALSGDTAAGGDYWWSYENVLFLSINSNNLSTAQHRSFLQDAIAAYKAQNGGKDPLWKIVSFHHAPYSVASHTTDGDILQRRTELPVVFKELGIDVVLGGHDHSYARSLMMDGTTPITTGYTVDGANQYASYTDSVPAHDTLYIAANSASGSKYYAIQNLSFPFLAKDNQENTPNIGKVDVSADKLVFTVYRTGAANTVNDVVDTFTLKRLKTQDAPAGLAGVAPTSIANGDGKITGVDTSMEYKLSTADVYAPVTGASITGLVPGAYLVRYAAKDGFSASAPTQVTVPAWDGLALNIGSEQKAGGSYKRAITGLESGSVHLQGKFLVVRFQEKRGFHRRTWSMVVPAVAQTTVYYYVEGTTVEAWLTDGVPNEVSDDMKDVEVLAYAKSDVPVKSVSLSHDCGLALFTGETRQLAASVLPCDASNKAVTWSSSNTAVATVDADGLVKAVGPGKAVVTVTTQDGGKQDSCSVTVLSPVAVKGVTLTPSSATIRVGQSSCLSSVVSPMNATNKSVTWSSSDRSIVSVDQSGKYTGLKAGTATITVKTVDGGKTGTCKVTVVKSGSR